MVRQFLALALLSIALILPVQAAKKTPPPTQYQITRLAMFATESAAPFGRIRTVILFSPNLTPLTATRAAQR